MEWGLEDTFLKVCHLLSFISLHPRAFTKPHLSLHQHSAGTLDVGSERKIIRGHWYQNAQSLAGHNSDYDDDDNETSDEEEETGGDADNAHAIWTRSRHGTDDASGARRILS